MAHLPEWSELAKIDPEFDAINKGIPPGPTLEEIGDPVLIRRLSAALMAANKPRANLTGIRKSSITIPMRDGYKIHALLYQALPDSGFDRPEGQPRPLNVWYHGGGWCMGDPEDDEWLCADWVRQTGGVAVSVAYRRAPEKKFPVPVEDSWDALQWIVANASYLHATPQQGLLIGGASAGGNIATVLTHLARDTHLTPPITGLVLQVPFLLARQAAPAKYAHLHRSYAELANAPMCDVKNLDYLIGVYAPDPASPLFSPILWADGGAHARMPPTYFQVAGMDPLRDDALLYEKILREEYAVPTKIDVYVGCPHGFWSALPGLEQSRRLVNDLAAGWGWLLDLRTAKDEGRSKKEAEMERGLKTLRDVVEEGRVRSNL